MSYTLKNDVLQSFQGKYHDFVESNLLPEKKDNKVLIKYYAKVEKIIEKPVSNITSDKNYIWTRNHVKKYIKNKKAFIWVLRIYTLEKPFWAEPTPGAIRYANLKETISLENINPVLADSTYENILNKLK